VRFSDTVGDPCAAGSRPVWLALTPEPVLAFLHAPPPGAARRTAVLMCSPFGWQENCSYRGRRRWALAMAEAGFPSATFDLPGSGDSGGSARDPGRLEAWTGAVAGAAAWLADATDADRIVAIGIGLGGMLACRAVASGAPIDDLILWEVPAHGRTLVRELTAYSQMLASMRPEDQRAPGPDGDLDCSGYLLSGETVRDLEGLNLPALELPDATRRRVLLLGRDGRAPDRRLREYFEQAGAAVTGEPTDDFRDLMLHPQKSRTPSNTIVRTISWLSEREDSDPSHPSDQVARRGAEPLERGSVDVAWGDATVRETPIRFDGPAGEMFAVHAESTELAPAPVCAVWLNGGALRHTGPNRAWVEVARRWAARGVPTVRVDHLGIGDSDGADEDVSDASLYRPERIDETMAVLDQLSERGLGDRFILGGLCSGGYWSLHAALADARVAGVMLLNMSMLFWSDALVHERMTARSLSALRGPGWRRLARGDMTLADIRTVAESMRPTRLRLAAEHRVERGQEADVESAFDQLRDQRTQVLMLLSRGALLHDQLLRQGALDQPERWPNLTVERIPSQDHMFRAPWVQQHVHDVLDRALDRVLAAESPPGRVH
jgi:alpha-beta hydrolase superfamily lysophospholipase